MCRPVGEIQGFKVGVAIAEFKWEFFGMFFFLRVVVYLLTQSKD